MSNCDHKFIDSPNCLKCGVSWAELMKASYSDALEKLSECGKEIVAKDHEIAELKKKVLRLRSHTADVCVICNYSRDADSVCKCGELPPSTEERLKIWAHSFQAWTEQIARSQDRIAAMAALLDEAPHLRAYGGNCLLECVQCRWAKLKEGL